MERSPTRSAAPRRYSAGLGSGFRKCGWFSSRCIISSDMPKRCCTPAGSCASAESGTFAMSDTMSSGRLEKFLRTCASSCLCSSFLFLDRSFFFSTAGTAVNVLVSHFSLQRMQLQ